MGLFSYIFGDPFIEGIGQTLLDYFESESFPMELLQDRTLNILYTKNQLMKSIEDKSLSDEEFLKRLDIIFDEYHKRAGDPPYKPI